MSNYKAPLDDINFILNDVLKIHDLSSEMPSYELADFNTTKMILDSA